MSAYEANSCTFILLTCLDTLSLSIRRFWGEGGKMEAKKGES